MDHRTFVAALSAREKTELTTKSNHIGLSHLIVHLGAITMLGDLILAGVPGWPLLVMPQGILIVFLFTLLHEIIHQRAFRSRWLNISVGSIAGFAILIAPCWFRCFHLAHHRHTQDWERDPELAEKKPETLFRYLHSLSGLPIWYANLNNLLRNASGQCRDSSVPEARRGVIHREAC